MRAEVSAKSSALFKYYLSSSFLVLHLQLNSPRLHMWMEAFPPHCIVASLSSLPISSIWLITSFPGLKMPSTEKEQQMMVEWMNGLTSRTSSEMGNSTDNETAHSVIWTNEVDPLGQGLYWLIRILTAVNALKQRSQSRAGLKVLEDSRSAD